jgi:hypothetical protein
MYSDFLLPDNTEPESSVSKGHLGKQRVRESNSLLADIKFHTHCELFQ